VRRIGDEAVMNHINADPQDGGEIGKRERVQSHPTREKNAKNGFRFNINWAAIGALVALIGLYLTYAGVKHIWPFQVHCPVIAGAPPNSVKEAHASGLGNGKAEVFWSPPKCIGSDHPIIQYDITVWRVVDGVPVRPVRSIKATHARTSIIIVGLNNTDFYTFHVNAVNSIGPSSPVATNQITPTSVGQRLAKSF
jgi:Fibronectin type III domain